MITVAVRPTTKEQRNHKETLSSHNSPPQNERHYNQDDAKAAKGDSYNHHQVKVAPGLVEFRLDLVAVLVEVDLKIEMHVGIPFTASSSSLV